VAAITSNGAGGGPFSVGASWAGGAAPGLGDTAQVVAGDTITIDATFSVGDDTATPALDVLNGGTLDWDNAGSDTCTFRGDFYVRNGGTLTLDGTGVLANVLTIELNDSAAPADGKYGLIVEDGAIVDVDGFDKTRSWDTLSADAAAAQKDCVTTNDNSAVWLVGDTFVVGSMSQKTKTGAETDTIGAFAGTTVTKAGANYGFAHEQNVAICNLTRNVVITSANVAFEGYIWITNSVPGNVDFQWTEFSYLGMNAANKYGITITAGDYATLQYCAIHHAGYYGVISNGGTPQVDYTVVALSANNQVVGTTVSGGGWDLTDVVFIGGDVHGCFQVVPDSFTNCHWANNDNTGNYMSTSTAVQNQVAFTDCRFYANGIEGCLTGNGQYCDFDGCAFDGNTQGFETDNPSAVLTDCSFGAQVANSNQDFDLTASALVTSTGTNTTTLNVVTTGGTPGIRLSVDDTANNHKTWKVVGSYEKQGAVVRSGTYAMLMSPTSATVALMAESSVPAINGTQVAVTGYFRKNATYGAANLPYLLLTGAGVTSSTSTMTDVDDTWQLLTVSGTPTRTGFCKVRFICQSAGAGAAVYVDDVKMVYTAIDTGSFDYWYEGDVPPVMMATGLGAVDVWDVQTTQISAAGSIGLQLETNVDATTSSRATQADILNDATPFAGANIANLDQALSTTESNIRGADGDDLKDISDEIATITVDNAAIAAAVWSYVTRTLTAGGLTAAEVWSYATRTLTQTAASILAALEGSVITVYQYSLWTFSITGLGDISDRSRLYFTAKTDLDSDDDEAATIVQLEETDGLLYIGGAAPTLATLGTLTVDDEILGNITGTVDPSVTGLPNQIGHYDVKRVTAAGVALPPITINTFQIKSSVTKAVA
jgi:hypothetical protein